MHVLTMQAIQIVCLQLFLASSVRSKLPVKNPQAECNIFHVSEMQYNYILIVLACFTSKNGHGCLVGLHAIESS